MIGTEVDIFSVFNGVSSSLQLHLCLIIGKTWAGTEPFVSLDYASDSLLLSDDSAHASLWNGIFFPKEGFGDLAEQHDEQKVSQNDKLSHSLLPNCQTHKMLSKWWYQPIFHTFAPQAPALRQLQTSVVTHGRFSFSSIYVNKYLLVPLFTESALKRHVS